jgi:hypothetical protein
VDIVKISVGYVPVPGFLLGFERWFGMKQSVP